jgi:hypothetical protein
MEDTQEAKKTAEETRGEYLFIKDGHPSTWPRLRQQVGPFPSWIR